MLAPAEKGKSDDELRVRPQDDRARHDESGKDDSGKSQKTDKKDHEEPKVDQAKIDQARAQMYETFGLPDPEAQTSAADKKRFQLVNTDPFKTLSDHRVESLKTEDGKYFVSGVTSLDKEHLQNIFEEQGINLQIEFPKDWNTRPDIEKRRWLREQGISVVVPIRGGDVNDFMADLPDEGAVAGDLGNYIREIKRVATGARSSQDKSSALQNIEQELTNTKLRGGLTASDGSIVQVQEALSKGINDFGIEAMRERAEAAPRMGRREVEAYQRDTEFEIPTKEATDKLLTLAKEGKTTGADWDAALKDVNEKIEEVKKLAEADEPAEFKKAYFIAKGLESAFYENEAAVNSLPADIRNRVSQVLEKDNGLVAQLDRKFNSQFNMMDKKRQHSLVGDIDSNATTYLKMISAGWGETLESAKDKLLGMIGEDSTGLREWRVIKLIEGLEQTVRVKQSTEVIPIWQEIPEKMTTVFSQMESMDFSVEELSAAANEAITLVRSIAPDTPEGRALRDDLVAQLEAFRAFHSFRITMERNDMNPKEMLGIFQQYFDDETWEKFAERFSRDDRFREFVDAKGEAVNLFDISFSQYSEKLRQDRIKMNMVEELTRRAIENPLSDSEIREVARSMNRKVDDDFKSQVENLRQYFVLKMQAKIDKEGLAGKVTIDQIWGRKNELKFKVGAEEKVFNGIKVTHKLVEEWHQKQTMQGAFGYVEKDDVEFLAQGGLDLLAESDIVRGVLEKNGVDLTTDDGKKKAEEILVRRSYLTLRQEELRGGLAAELKDLGLHVKVDKDSALLRVDVDDLEKGGFLDSVNKNAYHTTWMFEWSNYDSIRVYSRDTTSGLDDDFESIVIHQSTNMFWGRSIDHIWEFYHDTNENRGRPKENDVNRLWKQHLPGKHHYLFPQNSTMVRWVENFMSDEQKSDLERRTQEMMQRWDFDNAKYHEDFYGWMRNAALMDMIENGEVSMSDAEDKKKFKFSEVVKAGKIRKFEMVDVFVDRDKHREYAGPQGFQAYLANPTNERFIELNDKTKTFYSTRGARQFPFMSLAFRAHWDVNSKHRRRLFDAPNITSVAGEHVADTLEARGDMERKQVEHEKRKLLGFKSMTVGGAMGVPKVGEFETPGAFGAMLGTTPFRRLRQTLEFGRKSAWEAKHVPVVLPFFALFGFIWGGFTEFLKQSVNQASGRQR